MLASTAFFLGLLLGVILVLILQFYDKKTTKECPVCKQAKELQEKEEEALKKRVERPTNRLQKLISNF